MERRDFIRTSAFSGVYALGSSLISENFMILPDETWFNRPMRWAQLTLVENDPGQFDPDFWLSYFRRVQNGQKTSYEVNGDKVVVNVPQIFDHEIIGIDFK